MHQEPSSDCDLNTTNVEVGVQTEYPPVHHETQPLSGYQHEDLVVLSRSFSELLMKRGISLPDDFLTYSAEAMMQLLKSNRSNVVYKLVQGIGTLRSDGFDSCFPCKRMPMGLLEYMTDFFSSKNIQQVCSSGCMGIVGL